jgi:hypothetical protein
MAITQTISVLPAAPDPAVDAPATFSSKAAAFVLAQKQMVPEMNTWVGQANSLSDDVNNWSSIAAQSSLDAQAAAAASAAASTATKWNPATNYAQGTAVWSLVDFLPYRRKVAGTTATDPANDPANWQIQTIKPSVKRSARNANAVLTAIDNAKLIDITANTFTQTFDAAANLGDGWYVWIRNAGTGDITLDPNGAETIDGLASFVMYPGEVRLVQTDGAALRSFVIRPFYKTDTTAGNFIKPPGYLRFDGGMWAGGASGGRIALGGGVVAFGGGGGAYVPFSFPASALSASEPYVVGAGGAAVSVIAPTGNPGGNSTFKGLTAYGGGGSNGAGGAAFFSNGTGVVMGPTSDTLYGGGATNGGTSSLAGRTVYGGGAGSSYDTGDGIRTPGPSVFGGQGGTADGAAGTAPGGGGAAAKNAAQSGAGARGEFRIWGVV